ncbi:unnamed protein product [Acanthoscelides obtectus]|uniref:Uncharacterized protein n=1 Tax=Acanthoscelides obtectus TaxID=200917 RepID=A0A9P0KDC7_ACAOB|nr:unnamed protein product [Acanthoscelides obtectus]CAK1645359.1 hypothetical protein AOBTE_LOCUS14095 [Acanthoscelides obtectus]
MGLQSVDQGSAVQTELIFTAIVIRISMEFSRKAKDEEDS